MKPVVLALAVVGSIIGVIGGAARTAEGSERSPLSVYAGFGHDPAADEERFRVEDRAREQVIARCMAARGYVYVASPAVVVDVDVSGSREQLWSLIQADPNNQHLRSLAPKARESYSLALAGVRDANNPDGPIGGCIGSAHSQIPGVYAAYGELLIPFEEMQKSIAADSRTKAAEARWAACAERGGFHYNSPRAMWAALDES